MNTVTVKTKQRKEGEGDGGWDAGVKGRVVNRSQAEGSQKGEDDWMS